MTERRPEYAAMSNRETPNRDPLADLLPRVVENPEFVAWALAKYRRIEGISEEELRTRLNLDARAYTRLSLCEMPVDDPQHFGQHLEQIATYTGVDMGAFANLLREVAALEALPPRTIEGVSTTAVATPKPASAQSFFMAARDREAGPASLSERKLYYKTEAQRADEAANESGDVATDKPHDRSSEESAKSSRAQTDPDRTSDHPQANPPASKDSSDDNPDNQPDTSDPARRG